MLGSCPQAHLHFLRECLLINKKKRCPARKDLLEGTLLEDVAYTWYLALGLNLHSLREWLLINTRHF